MVGRRRWTGEIAPGWPAPEERIPKRKPLRAAKLPAVEGQVCSVSGCDEPAAYLVGTGAMKAYCSGHDPTKF